MKAWALAIGLGLLALFVCFARLIETDEPDPLRPKAIRGDLFRAHCFGLDHDDRRGAGSVSLRVRDRASPLLASKLMCYLMRSIAVATRQ